MKNIFLILSILLFAFLIVPAQQVIKSDAVNLILNQILINDVGKADISIFKHPISQAEGLQLCFNEKIQCPYPSNWVFFIDDNVFANWGHPCRYIFINTANKEFKIINNTAPPSDTTGWESISPAKRPEPKILKSAPYHKAVIQSVTPNPHCYAVIINGGWNPSLNYPRFWNDISAIYCTLTQVYGYPSNHIFVHSTDGTATNNQGSLDLNNDGINEINYPASLSSIRSTFETLAGIMQPSDQLFIFVADHGNIDNNGNSLIALWSPDEMFPTDLNNMLSGINASEIIIVLTECFSGGFITDAVNIKGPHRIIQTACSATEESNPNPAKLYVICHRKL